MMQSASAERSNLGSPSEMDGSRAKRSKLDLPNGHVKQEADGEGGAGAVVAAEHGPPQMDLLAARIDPRVFNCPVCSRPYKPPVLKCKVGGHCACAACVAELPGGQCNTCEDGGGFERCTMMDAIVSSVSVACPHAGCRRFVVYHEAGEHQNACAHMSCHCTEPGCGSFAASPAALANHLASEHAVPVHNIKYGKVSWLQVSESVPRLLLVAEEDRRVFLLIMGPYGGGAAVTAVCVRASASAWPRFTCKMWVNRPVPEANNSSDKLLMDLHVRSSTSPGAVVAADEPTFLSVLPRYLVPGPDDDGPPSREVTVSVRIDMLSASPC